MITLKIEGTTIEELQEQYKLVGGLFVGYQYQPPVDTIVKAPVSEPPTEIKPVLTQEQVEENIANAPVHEEPPQPTLEDVRDAMKARRDKKGAGAVKELLKAYGAKSVPELKPEDYLGAMSRAYAEV